MRLDAAIDAFITDWKADGQIRSPHTERAYDGTEMKGVHRERDIAYNAIHGFDAPARKQGSHSWMHRDLGNKPKVCVMCGTTDPWAPCIIDRVVAA